MRNRLVQLRNCRNRARAFLRCEPLPVSTVAKIKDGQTHLAHKAEHGVDLEAEGMLAASIRPADEGDTDTLVASVVEARMNLSEADRDVEIEEAVADKGSHSHTLASLVSAPAVTSRRHMDMRDCRLIVGETNGYGLFQRTASCIRADHG